MKKLASIVSALFLFVSSLEAGVVWTDASALPVFGKADPDTEGQYGRLPKYLKDVSRPSVWGLGRHSAGLYVRFRSDSPSIWCDWTVRSKTEMNHMTGVGERGVDLYVLEPDGFWRFVSAGRPSNTSNNTVQQLIGNMEPQMREYMLYLSLYDAVDSLKIGVDSSYVVEQPQVESPRTDRKIVMYGTSILQGGCANRPGMAFTNIIARKLDREVINLGFSGNAHLDYDIARLMASVKDPAVFVFDYVPNAGAGMIEEKGEAFFRIVRDAHPDVPVFFVEAPDYGHCGYDKGTTADVDARNAAQRKLYDTLRKQGEKRIYYLSNRKMLGDDHEVFVENVHFTDLGMARYAEWIIPQLKRHMLK